MGKIKTFFHVFRSIIPSIYFNFHYLPFRQAIKLPVLLYKPKLVNLGGGFRIECNNIHTGMIKFGFPRVYLYPNAGVTYENWGGIVIIKGNVNFGNSTAISIGKYGNLTIGDHVTAPAALKLVCYHKVDIGNKTSFGWDCLLMDTDLHSLTYIDETGNTRKSKGVAPISIGSEVWFGNGCLIMKGAITPDKVVFGARSVINKIIEVKECTLVGGNPLRELKKNVYRNMQDDLIDYK